MTARAVRCQPLTYLEASAARRPDAPAVYEEGDTTSFAELLAAVRTIMALLAQAGVRPGEVVAVSLPNTGAYVATELAVPALGAVLLPLPLALGSYEIEASLRRAGVVVVVVDDAVGGVTREVAHSVASVRAVIPAPRLAAAAAEPAAAVPVHPTAPHEIVQIALTSGTTGLPKLASLSAELKQLTFEGFTGRLGIGPDDRVLPLSPLSQGVGEMCLYALRQGACMVMAHEPRFSPAHALDLAQRSGATVLGCVPTMVGRMLGSPELDGADLSAVRITAVAGAPMPPDLARRWEERTGAPVCNFYGAMDVGQLAVASPNDPPEKRWHTVGRPHETADVMVCDDRGSPVAPGREGEICMRGPLVQTRYWGEDHGPYADDGWAHFGDLGFIDADGYVHVIGRIKDIIIRGGSNINPHEVEALLTEHPRISEACVVGCPDVDLGERAVAFVVAQDAGTVTVQDVRSFLAGRGLARYKWPEQVVTVPELPVVGSGKIARAQLRQRVAAPAPGPQLMVRSGGEDR